MNRVYLYWAIIPLLLLKSCAQNHLRISWTQASQLPDSLKKKHLGVAGAFVGVHNDVLLVAGGANFPNKMPWQGGIKAYHQNIYLFKRRGDSLSCIGQQYLPKPTAYGMSTSTPQGIVCAGGENDKGDMNDVFLWHWNASTQEAQTTKLPPLPFPLVNALIASQEHKIYVAGGESKGQTRGDFLLLDLKNLSLGWQPLPALPIVTSHAMGGIANNRLFLFGGRRKNPNGISTFYQEGYAFDFQQNLWTKVAPLPYSLSAGTCIAIDSQRLLLVSGDKGDTFLKVETLRQAKADTAQISQYLRHHPGFIPNVWLYDTSHNKWHLLASMPTQGQVTTTAVLWEDDVYIPSGEIKAGVRTPAIWKGKKH